MSLAGPEFPAGSIRENAGSVQLMLPRRRSLRIFEGYFLLLQMLSSGRQLISLGEKLDQRRPQLREPSCRSEITKSKLPSISVISGARAIALSERWCPS